MATPEPLSTVPSVAPGTAAYAAQVAPFVTTVVPAPATVVAARNGSDVCAAVAWAAAAGHRVSVQATGHQLLTDLAGTVLVSTRGLDAVRIDPERARATVGAGVRWSRVVAAAARHGLAPACGSSSRIGVVGFALGGGHGHLTRAHGVTADHVRRLRVVTADGVERDVDADHEPDLFWALRGGKSGFGIVTELEIDLFAVTRLVGGGLFFPGEASPEVLHTWREWAPTLPEEASTSLALLRLPPDPAVPRPLRGAFVAHLRFAHLGPPEDAARLLAPVRAVATPIADLVTEMPATAVDAVHADGSVPTPVWDSATLGALPADAVDAVLAVAGPGVAGAPATTELRLLGGAAARPTALGNAVAGRDAAFGLAVHAPGPRPAGHDSPAAGDPTAASVVDAVRPWSVGRLPNFVGPGTAGRLGDCWDGPTLTRLLAIRDRHDPGGVFRAGLVHDRP